MKKKTSKSNVVTPRKPPANRKITKEGVATAMALLQRQGSPITTATLFEALGKKGSYSTLIRLRKEIEAESPALVQDRGVSLANAIKFIDGCDYSIVPALEAAVIKRLRIVGLENEKLWVSIARSPEALDILDELRAERLPRTEWTYYSRWYFGATIDNYKAAKRLGFTCRNEENILEGLRRIERRAGLLPMF